MHVTCITPVILPVSGCVFPSPTFAVFLLLSAFTLSYTGTGTQIYRYTGIQVQVYRYTGIQVYRYRYTGTQVHVRAWIIHIRMSVVYLIRLM